MVISGLRSGWAYRQEEPCKSRNSSCSITVPITPLTNLLVVSLPKVLANSTASLIAALGGTSASNFTSYSANLRIVRSMLAK